MNQWSLLFVAPLLAYSAPWFAGYGFSGHYLLVPLAVLLGWRYGLTGAIFVALTGIVFVINVGGPWGSFGGNPALYLVALAVAAIAAAPRQMPDWPSWPSDGFKAGWLAFMATFLLVIEAGTAYMRLSDTGLWFAFRFPLAPLGFFMLFAMGARGVRLAPVLLGLATVAALTWWLAQLGVLARAPTAFFVTVDPLDPNVAAAALASFSAGAAMNALLHGRTLPDFWSRPGIAIGVLVLLWFVPEVLTTLAGHDTSVLGIYLGQAPVLLPLAAFMAGLLRGARGVVLVNALVPALLVAWMIVIWLQPELFAWKGRTGRLPLEAPLVTAAWSVLGAMLAQSRSGTHKFRLPRYPAYVALLGVGALAMFAGPGPLRLALLVLLVAGGLTIYFAGQRLGRSMAASGYAITPERWVSFTALVLLVASVAVNFQLIVMTLREYYYRFPLLHAVHNPVDAATVRRFLGASISPELAALLVAFAAIYVLALLSLLGSLVSSVPKVLGDMRRIAQFVRHEEPEDPRDPKDRALP